MNVVIVLVRHVFRQPLDTADKAFKDFSPGGRLLFRNAELLNRYLRTVRWSLPIKNDYAFSDISGVAHDNSSANGRIIGNNSAIIELCSTASLRMLNKLLIQMGILPAGGDEFFVGAAFDDLAVVDHQYHIRGHDGAQAVGDHERGSTGEQLFQ